MGSSTAVPGSRRPIRSGRRPEGRGLGRGGLVDAAPVLHELLPAHAVGVVHVVGVERAASVGFGLGKQSGDHDDVALRDDQRGRVEGFSGRGDGTVRESAPHELLQPRPAGRVVGDVLEIVLGDEFLDRAGVPRVEDTTVEVHHQALVRLDVMRRGRRHGGRPRRRTRCGGPRWGDLVEGRPPLGDPSVADPVGGERVVVEGGAGGVRVRLRHVVAHTDQVLLRDDEHRIPWPGGPDRALVRRRSAVELAAQEIGERPRAVRDVGTVLDQVRGDVVGDRVGVPRAEDIAEEPADQKCVDGWVSLW